eukprot:GFKZ01015001.1.p1 GENE.GFKZ01015001.1~~GFKZ01015001.1.p1  ORF type:complete len:639 (-),score=41.50 GFKZ01015001.1:50-1966(-)
MTLDPSNGFTYICGRTTGPRSPNTSLPGLLPSNALLDGVITPTTPFTDPVIAKLDTSTGHLVWAHRLNPSHPTSFSELTLSPSNNTIYAAGIQVVSPEQHPWILQAFDVETGLPTGPLLQSHTPAVYRLASLTADHQSIYLCGSVSTPPDSALLIRVSLTGSTLWALSPDLAATFNASCISLALHTPTTRLFAILAPPNPAPSSPATFQVIALDARTGAFLWTQSLTSPPGTLLRASELIVHADALFLSFSMYGGAPALNRLHIAKMSQTHGTLLWNMETCCTNLPLDQHIARFQGFGDATHIRGMAVRNDGYVYHSAYYRRHDAMTDDRFATVISRVGQYGTRSRTTDVSYPIEHFQLIPGEPKQSFLAPTRGSALSTHAYLISNKLTIHNNTLTNMVTTLDVIHTTANPRPDLAKWNTGAAFVNVTFDVQIRGVAAATVLDIFTERLGIRAAQLGAQPAMAAGVDVWQVWIWAAGNEASAVHDKLQEVVWTLLGKTGTSGNVIEAHFTPQQASVTIIPESWNTASQGILAEATDGERDAGSLAGNMQDGMIEGSSGGGVWGVVTVVCGVLAGVGLTALTVVIGWGWVSGRLGEAQTQEIEVEEGEVAPEMFDGRPKDDGVQVVYEAAAVRAARQTA